MKKTQIGLYGNNGHQIQVALADHPRAELAAVAAFDLTALPANLKGKSDLRRYDSLAELLQDRRIELVSLCSPRRADQATDAIRCLEAGKHVYAEKPCAMTEFDLDAIIAAARQTGRQFHEMAGTAFGQPFLEMRRLVLAGVIGCVVQVLAQKSYPYADWRPQDEDLDGGLIMQNGVHAMRFIEHVANVRIATIAAVETKLANPRAGNLHMAASYLMTLENDGVASAVANYLNPHPAFETWGNEMLRIFGTEGFLEATDGGTRTRLVLKNKDHGPIDVSAPSRDYLDLYLAALQGEGTMPLSLDEELHPTRMVIRAKASCFQRGG